MKRRPRLHDAPIRYQILLPFGLLALLSIVVAEVLITPNNRDPETVAIMVGSVAGLVGLGWAFSMRFSNRLEHIARAAQRLGEGDLAHRIESRGNDELAALGEAFNRMAEELQASHEELERRVHARTRDLEERTRQLIDALGELREANGRLRTASHDRMRFVADVAHEVRTPLASILLGADLLRNPDMLRPDSEAQREIAQQIHASSRHLVGMLDDLMDLARLESGNLSIQPTATLVAGLLREVATIAEPLAADGGVRLHVDGHQSINPRQRVQTDPVRARQVLLNLVTNAIKAARPGGHVEVLVAGDGDGDGDGVRFSVRDSGDGIPAHEIERIFQPFEQLDVACGGGMGLGLAIARRITELMAGRLTVESTPGAGSTFTVWLPAAEALRSVPADAEADADNLAG